jgi:hypothetical protein
VWGFALSGCAAWSGLVFYFFAIAVLEVVSQKKCNKKRQKREKVHLQLLGFRGGELSRERKLPS